MPGQAGGLRTTLRKSRLPSLWSPRLFCQTGDRAGPWGLRETKVAPLSGLEKHLAHTLVPGHLEGPGEGTVWGSATHQPRDWQAQDLPVCALGQMHPFRVVGKHPGGQGSEGLWALSRFEVKPCPRTHCPASRPILAPAVTLPTQRDSGQRSSCRQAPSSRQRLGVTPSRLAKSPFPATPLPAPSPGRPPPVRVS